MPKTAGSTPVPLYSIATLRSIESSALRGLPRGELMRRAGERAAAWLQQQPGRPRSFIVVCGGGNNGGDGYVCATALARDGCSVRCVALAPPTTDDARAARARWDAAGGETLAVLPSRADADAIVDAMLGIGVARPLAGAYAAAARWINEAGVPVYALDVPSGLDADTGNWIGDVPGVSADATLTFLGDKPGLHTADGCDAAGRVDVATLDVDGGDGDGMLSAPLLFPHVLQARRRNSHKGSFGSIAVVGGAAGMVGAALLAARAALRMGTGRVYVDCFGATDLRFDPAQPELMFRSLAALRDVDAVVVGCGMGTADAARTSLLATFARNVPLVVDADALNLAASEPSLGAALSALPVPKVLTPHPLEAARLLDCAARDVQRDRVRAARELAAHMHATVVLKGAGTVIAFPDGRWCINPTGGPALATAGTGDVLAGIIGSFIAQGAPAEESALAGAWLHGAAADETEADVGLVASEIAPRAVRRLAALRAASGRQRPEA